MVMPSEKISADLSWGPCVSAEDKFSSSGAIYLESPSSKSPLKIGEMILDCPKSVSFKLFFWSTKMFSMKP